MKTILVLLLVTVVVFGAEIRREDIEIQTISQSFDNQKVDIELLTDAKEEKKIIEKTHRPIEQEESKQSEQKQAKTVQKVKPQEQTQTRQKKTSLIIEENTKSHNTRDNHRHNHKRYNQDYQSSQQRDRPDRFEEFPQEEQELTDEERAERRHERRRYNHYFKVGMIIATGIIAFALIKCCIAKKRRCRRGMMQRQQPMREMVEPQIQQRPVGNVTYFQNPHFQVAQNPRQQPYQPHQQPQQFVRQPQHQVPQQQMPVSQQVRGRMHDSFSNNLAQQELSVLDQQIKHHEAQLNKLKVLEKQRMEQIERQQELQCMRAESYPVKTSESFESNHPTYQGRIPIGKPIKDQNSSFASDYPEI